MDTGRRIILWTAAGCGAAFALGILWASGFHGLIPLIPTLYAIPYTIGRIQLSRTMHRELKAMLDG
jgi:hypothetical protein